ncbi:TetR/AcrR family transcriptional regulator [Streptomyces liangshanensis]|uniref:TetR/AcrR family transcriptional regulator n=1 Tax=Streptomyces liangshanensis TaxID=2717324 RepID=A0A6G9GTX7_9ACTN|nr:TetR/AcrR family transcriptional regulator [Streptomyces liangshanensis]QIQ01650.1 TetR/AcrR family transcriptional regulator [Streptomyces liangshanensis]
MSGARTEKQTERQAGRTAAGSGAGRARRTGPADGRVERGNRTRRLVLDHTMDVASVEGLEGLSLGRIATELRLSKSGVFALFGSKEELQLATVRAAVDVYVAHVVRPARELPPGPERVWALCRNWLAYSANRVFRGGCFFHGVSAEFDARGGPVHDAIAEARTEWVSYVERALNAARRAGGLAADTDVPQVAFEIIALMEAANARSVLHGEAVAYERAGRAVLRRLREVATDPGALPEEPGEIGGPGTA